MLKSVCVCQQAVRSVRHGTYLNIANPKYGIRGLDSLLHAFIGAGACVQPAEVRHCFVNAALAHVCVEGREAGQFGELSTLILEVVAGSEPIDDNDRILALLHHRAELVHDILLEL